MIRTHLKCGRPLYILRTSPLHNRLNYWVAQFQQAFYISNETNILDLLLYLSVIFYVASFSEFYSRFLCSHCLTRSLNVAILTRGLSYWPIFIGHVQLCHSLGVAIMAALLRLWNSSTFSKPHALSSLCRLYHLLPSSKLYLSSKYALASDNYEKRGSLADSVACHILLRWPTSTNLSSILLSRWASPWLVHTIFESIRGFKEAASPKALICSTTVLGRVDSAL